MNNQKNCQPYLGLDKNKRKWIRFTTLYRKGEALRALNNMLLVNKMGLVTNKPLFVYEERFMGLVVFSYCVYEYLEGIPPAKDDYPKVVEILNVIHQNNYLHNDAHLENFLKQNEQLCLIDANLKKNRIFKRYRIAYEFVYLLRMNPEINQYVNFNKGSFYYWFADLNYEYLVFWRKIKRFFRSFLKKNK